MQNQDAMSGVFILGSALFSLSGCGSTSVVSTDYPLQVLQAAR